MPFRFDNNYTKKQVNQAMVCPRAGKSVRARNINFNLCAQRMEPEIYF